MGIRYIQYEKELPYDVNSFVSECMTYFLGRAGKDRPDCMDIEGYYQKAGGNFWLAVEAETGRLVGSIALERDGDKGIMKRYYVLPQYHHQGIGRRLYEIFEQFARETGIRSLYLASGSVLKDSHRMYEKNGWKRTDKLDVTIPITEDDYLFYKEL